MDEAAKKKLIEQYNQLNPFVLQKTIQRKLKRIFSSSFYLVDLY